MSTKTQEELNQLLDVANELQQEYDECPVCGEEYEHTDCTRGGDIVFVHGNATPSTAECCDWEEQEEADIL